MQTDCDLVPVPIAWLDEMWPHARFFCKCALKHCRGEDTPEAFLDDCRRGRAQLWMAAKDKMVIAACGTSLDDRRDGTRVLNIRWISGTNYDAWHVHFDRVKAWAKEHGCRSVYYRGRPGWQRRRPQARVAGVIYEEAI
jgi:hypothetical protein